MEKVRKPFPLDVVRGLGLLVFGQPYSANLIAVRGPGRPGERDGLLYLVWREDADGGWVQRVWPCATRPGLPYLRRPIHPGGTGMLAAGVQNRLSHRIGLHHPGGVGERPALVQVGTVRVLRDPDRDDVHEPMVPEDNQGGGFNVHSVAHPEQLAGCIGLSERHMGELLAAFGELAHRQGKCVSLTVVEGEA